MDRSIRVHHAGRWWTPDEIAAHCGMGRKAVYNRIRRGVEGAALFRASMPGRRIAPVKEGLIDPDLPYDQDPVAQAFVRENPDGMCLREIGDLLGITPQGVELMVQRALRQLEDAAGHLR